MMENLDLILPEIFTSCSIMLFLIIGVFKKNSSILIYNLSTIFLVVPATLSVRNSIVDFTSAKSVNLLPGTSSNLAHGTIYS